jgi:hypothetical protein
MTKKNVWLFAGLAALAIIYVCFFTTWFKHKSIGIFDSARPLRHARNRGELPYILFGLDNGLLQLTEIKVVSLTQYQANPNAPSLWHLVSDSNSVPIQEFVYGQRIRGMRPAFKGDQPQDLETNVTYRLFVTAGGEKGFHDFKIK